MVEKPPAGDRPLKTLERVLSKAGLGSRKESRRLIEQGRVRVNGAEERDPDRWVDLERDGIEFDGAPLERPDPVYLAMHKPAGYLTTRDDRQGRATIYDLLPDRWQKLLYVGRLDLETRGLLLLTNDSAFVERMTNPAFHVSKTYVVRTDSRLGDAALDHLRSGVELEDGPTRPAEVERLSGGDGSTVSITITEGRNRQVRRMIEAVGSRVVDLLRVAVGPVELGSIPEGGWRELSWGELESLDTGRGR